jgi:RNA polymerase sigma-70 factor (ECF subfamily)
MGVLRQDMKDIIQGCIRKDKSSYKQLYDLFSSKMLTICRIYTRNNEDAQDVFQTGFIRIFENISQLKEPAALEWWMKKIFINESIVFYKKNTRYILDESQIPEENFQDNVTHKIDGEKVLLEINNLPFKMRQVFCMYVIDGYSHKEIANELNISEGTSKSNLHDARQLLKNRISNLYSTNESYLIKNE